VAYPTSTMYGADALPCIRSSSSSASSTSETEVEDAFCVSEARVPSFSVSVAIGASVGVGIEALLVARGSPDAAPAAPLRTGDALDGGLVLLFDVVQIRLVGEEGE